MSILVYFSQQGLLSPGAAPSGSRTGASVGVLWALNALLHGSTSCSFRANVKALFQREKVIETTFSSLSN